MRGWRVIDMTGRRFGRLLVVSRGERTRVYPGAYWLCQCDCGAQRTVSGDSLRRGSTRSCGCLMREISRATAPFRAKKHGACGTREYEAWANAKLRCFNPQISTFRYYGGRGITMAPEWRDDFAAFLKHVGPSPGPGYSLDRINNDGPYAPGNVRWATRHEQRVNQRAKGTA